MSQPLASVIIPAWNGRDHLPACLAALQAQEYAPLEIIVVDNASTDGSAELVAAQFPNVRLIRNAHNLGFAGGCNVGLRAARGDVLVLLNQDTQADPGWLAALAAALREPSVGVVGSRIFYPDGQTVQHAGAWIEWPLGLAHHLHDGVDGPPRPVEYVTAAALAFRRDLLARVGLLDEGFWPGYFEDADFCLRARAAGYEVCLVPAATLRHKETTSIKDAATVSRWYQRGRLRFLLKHLPPEQLLAEWVPAEEAFQPPAIFGLESLPLRLAYLEAIPEAVTLLRERWGADEATVEAVIRALQGLHQRAWARDWERTERRLDAARSPMGAGPALRPFHFRSQTPIVGPLLARLRAGWYNVAARWAVDDLRQQQERLNRALWGQQEAALAALEERTRALAEQNALLAAEIARLRLAADPQHQKPSFPEVSHQKPSFPEKPGF